MRLIGISGKAHAGKDSIANWLMEHRGAFVESFALPMKLAICQMFGITIDYFVDHSKKESPIPGIGRSPRYLAQTLGTQWGRELVTQDVWVNACQRRLDENHIWGAAGKVIVIADVRFENEAAWIRQHGLLLHIERPGADGNVGILGHASEAGIRYERTDILVRNDGTLDDLYGKLGAMFPRAVDPRLEDEGDE